MREHVVCSGDALFQKLSHGLWQWLFGHTKVVRPLRSHHPACIVVVCPSA